jgi:hypothetical protein
MEPKINPDLVYIRLQCSCNGGSSSIARFVEEEQSNSPHCHASLSLDTTRGFVYHDLELPRIKLSRGKKPLCYVPPLPLAGRILTIRVINSRPVFPTYAELATGRPGNRSRRRRVAAAQTTRDRRSQAVREWKGSGRNNENIMVNKWGDRWKAAVARSGRGVFAAKKGPNLDNHKIYKDMPKHKALILMQARTECMGMAEFLFWRHVSDVLSPLYSCGRASETPEHVLLYCPEIEEDRQDTRKRVAPIALRTRRNLAQLSTKHPKLITE